MLTDWQRRELISVARRSVAARVSGLALGIVSQEPLPPASGLFVTLKHDGVLRGCLGTLACVRDLVDEVARCAAAAATEDPRFPPVPPELAQQLTLEISILGALERLEPCDPEAITIGRHGLVVERGRNRGVLLPQVASERRWTALQFIRQTCIKADLAPDAWELGAAVYRFDAEVFGD
jgi:uncharacterized protein